MMLSSLYLKVHIGICKLTGPVTRQEISSYAGPGSFFKNLKFLLASSFKLILKLSRTCGG